MPAPAPVDAPGNCALTGLGVVQPRPTCAGSIAKRSCLMAPFVPPIRAPAVDGRAPAVAGRALAAPPGDAVDGRPRVRVGFEPFRRPPPPVDLAPAVPGRRGAAEAQCDGSLCCGRVDVLGRDLGAVLGRFGGGAFTRSDVPRIVAVATRPAIACLAQARPQAWMLPVIASATAEVPSASACGTMQCGLLPRSRSRIFGAAPRVGRDAGTMDATSARA